MAVTRPYTFRVLLHRDSTAQQQWRLLQQAYLATDTNGAELVFTDAFHAKTFAADHPECAVTRLSSANLPLIDPLPLLSDGTTPWGHVSTIDNVLDAADCERIR